MIIIFMFKRSKLFKQQESLQFEIVNDIVSKTDVLRKTTDRIANSYKNYDEKQMKLKQRYFSVTYKIFLYSISIYCISQQKKE